MGFDLTNYETVKQRKKRFYVDFPDGRILVKNISDKIQDYAMIEATIFKNVKEQEKNLPFSTGFALEIRDKEKSISSYGKEYESVNYTSWVENCEESAIGRALDNAGYAGNDKCSREEMEKVDRQKTAINNNKKSANKTESPKLNYRQTIINDIIDICKKTVFSDADRQNAKAKIQVCKTDKLEQLKKEYQEELDKRLESAEIPLNFKDDDPEDVKDIPII